MSQWVARQASGTAGTGARGGLRWAAASWTEEAPTTAPGDQLPWIDALPHDADCFVGVALMT